MKSVGIDIGSSQVKVVEVQTSSKGFQVVNAYIRNLSRATGTDLELEIIEFLRELMANYDPLATRFCVALRQDQVASRNKIFPFADRGKIQKSLPFELEEELPLSAENAVFDGKIIRIMGTSAEVLACAAPKPHVEHLLRLMKDSAVEPSLISTEGVAFANLIENWAAPIPVTPAPPPSLDEETPKVVRPIRVVLQIGHSRTLVCAFDEDRLVGVRSIMWGGRMIIDAISKKYNLALPDAQKELETKAFILTTKQEASYEAKIFSDLIAKCVRDLVRDLQLSLLEFKSEFGGVITDVQMTGGVSAIQGLAPFLTQHLEVPVNRLRIFDRFENVLIDKSDEADRRLGLALGLALEGLRKPRNPALNFMRGEFAPQSSFAKDLWSDWGSYIRAAGAASVLIFIWAFARGEIALILDDASRAVLVKQAQEIAKLPRSRANESSVKQYISTSRKRILEIRTLESLAGMNSAMDVLLNASDRSGDRTAFPLDIKDLEIEDDTLKLTGSLKGGKDRVDALAGFLAGAALPGSLKMGAVQVGVGKTDFSLSFKVDRDVQKVAR